MTGKMAFEDSVDVAGVPGGNAIGDLALRFKSATHKQMDYLQLLDERVDRLERDFDPEPLRESLHDFCRDFAAISREAQAGVDRAETGVAALHDAFETLTKDFASAREEIQHLRFSIREQRVELSEFTHRADARAEQAEQVAAGLRDGEARAASRLDELAHRLADHEQKTAAGFDEHDARAVKRIEELTSKLAALERKSAADLQEHDGRAATRIDELADKLAALEQKSAADLQERDAHAASQIEEWAERFTALERRYLADLHERDEHAARIAAIARDIETLQAQMGMALDEESHLSERLKVAETNLGSAREKEQALAQMYTRLAEAFSPAA
jgi:chromosome segregation ATPase